eukprot:22916-Chlamydomonas_euryale.AAC.3
MPEKAPMKEPILCMTWAYLKVLHQLFLLASACLMHMIHGKGTVTPRRAFSLVYKALKVSHLHHQVTTRWGQHARITVNAICCWKTLLRLSAALPTKTNSRQHAQCSPPPGF